MLHDALPLVTKLHIEKASQLRTGIVLRHLRDVRSVTIYNLFRTYSNSISHATLIEIDKDIATKSVSFISKRLTHLESVSFWGADGDSLCSFHPGGWKFDWGGCIYSLLDALSGAFDCRSLPHNLQIIGLSCPKRIIGSTIDCAYCNKVCKMFPLELVGEIDLCLPFTTCNEIIESREGGRDYLHSETRLMQLLGRCRVTETFDDFSIIEYQDNVQNEMESFIELSEVDVTKLNPQDVTKAIRKQYPNNISIFFSEESFDCLKSIGIPINNDLLDPNAARVENLARMVKHIVEETDVICNRSLNQLSTLLGKQKKQIQRVVESGVLQKLVELLQREDDHELQFASTDILANLASGTSEHVEEIVKLGAIPPLVHLLGSSFSEVPYNAAWALGNIAGDIPRYRDLVLQAGVMEPLLKLLDDHQTSDVKHVRFYVWVLHNLCRGNPKPGFSVVSRSLPILNELIYHSDEEVVADACWALRHLCKSRKHNQAVIDELGNKGVCRLVELLDHPSTTVQSPALRTLGKMAKGNGSQKQIVIDNNALPGLLTLLSSSNKDILQEVCWAISKITAGTVEQIQTVIDSDVFPKLIPLLSDGRLLKQIVSEEVDGQLLLARRRIRKKVGCAFANAVNHGNVKQIKYLANQGCIPLLTDLLNDRLFESTKARLNEALQLLEFTAKSRIVDQ